MSVVTSGSAVVTGINDTAWITNGMVITGTGIPANTVVSSINTAGTSFGGTGSITMSNVATANGTAITIALPANTSFNIWAYDDFQGIKRLIWGLAGGEGFTRLDGVLVNTSLINTNGVYNIAAQQGTYLGSIVTTVAGQTEDSAANRNIWNYYNRHRKMLSVSDGTQHTYNSATWRAWNNGATQYFAGFVVGVVEESVSFSLMSQIVSAADGVNYAFLGVSLNAYPNPQENSLNCLVNPQRYSVGMELMPQGGLNTAYVVESVTGTGTSTFYGYHLYGVVMG